MLLQLLARLFLFGAAIPSAIALSLFRFHCDIEAYHPWLQDAARYNCSLEQSYDKPLHVVAFMALTMLVSASFPRLRARLLILLMVGLAVSAELLQSIPGINRQPDWSDFFANLLGIGAALAVMILLRLLQATRKSR